MQITQRHNVYILVLSSVPRLYVFQRNSSPYVSKLSGGKPKRLPPVRPKRANTCTFSWPKQAESNNRSPPYRSAPPKSGRPQKRLQTRRSAHMVCAPKSDRRKQRLGQNKVRQQPPAFAASRDRPPIPRRPPVCMRDIEFWLSYSALKFPSSYISRKLTSFFGSQLEKIPINCS